MKYFTRELWENLNSSNRKKAAAADRQWDVNRAAYWKSVEPFMDRLQPSFRRNVMKKGLHDSQILRITMTPGRLYIVVETSEPTLPPYLGLSYTGIASLSFTKPEEQSFFSIPDVKEWGRWGYDEVDMVVNGPWKHNILIDNGFEIEVRCEKMRMLWTVPSGTRGC